MRAVTKMVLEWKRDGNSPSFRLTRCVLATLAFTALATACASAASASPAPTGPVAGSIGLRLLDVPSNEQNDPRARIYIVDHLAPGMVTTRQIEVSNTTSSNLHVLLYPAAATIANGSFLGAASHTPDALSIWTSVSPSSADVPSGGDITATVTIAVPSGTTSGERYGAVWAQVSSAPVAGSGITQISRVGIRIYLSVGTGEAPTSNFAITSLTAERSPAGQPIVLATVRNTGGLALDMSGSLRLLAGPSGLSAGPFPATLGTTLGIGDTEPVTIPLDKQLPAGPWDAMITLESGLIRHTAQATITFPKVGVAPPVSTTSVRPWWYYLTFIGLLTLLLLSTTLLLFILTRLLRRTHNGLPDYRLISSPLNVGTLPGRPPASR
jgi:hypothetical protein